MPSKRPKKRVKIAVDTIDTTDNTDNTSTSNSNGSRGDIAPVEKSHHPPSSLLQQPIHYQQQHCQQQYQPYAQYQHQQPYHLYQPQGYFMALPTDLELLEDFCAYLENRVLTKNLALLRRMLTEFLSRQELTLAQFKCFGANLIAVLPFDVLDQTKRAHADLLLQKKKHTLTDQTCAFEFLFARVATKNLAMLRQMFIEFRTHEDSSIHEFVKLGAAAISIVPYDPPHVFSVEQFAYTAPYASQPPYLPSQFGVSLPISQQLQYQYTPQSYQHQYQPLQHAYYSQQQQHYAPQPYRYHQHEHHPQYVEHGRQQQSDFMGVIGVMPKHERTKKIPTGSRKSHLAQDFSVRSPISSKAAARSADSSNNNSNSSSSGDAGAPVVGKRVVKKPVRYHKEQEEEELVAVVAKSSKRFKREQLAAAAACEAGFMPSPRVKSRRAREVDAKANSKSKNKQKASNTYSNSRTSMVMMDLNFFDSEEELEDDEELKLHELELQKQLSKTNNSGNKHTLDSMIDETLRQFEEHAEAEQRKLELKRRKMERQRLQDESKEAPLRQQATAEPRIASNGSAGWTRVDDTVLQIKTIVRDKLCKFEAHQPWKQVFRDLPLPFDEQKAPRLADQLRLFWKVHARAVWERNFWVPLVQDGDAKANVARKGRQRLASQMFDAIICDAFKAFGAEFFLKLDAERHPGWWYRGPILDILAFHRVVGGKKCWAFVESQLCERFPDCGLELPLKTPNYGVLRRHKSKSAAMWLNVPKAALILSKIVELKERRARAKLAGDGGDGDSNLSPSSNDPDASVEKEEDEGDGSEAVEVVERDGSSQTGGNIPVGGYDAGINDVAGAIDGDDDHGEDMVLPPTTDTDAADDENEDDKDEEEELLIEKIALASSLETDDTVLLTTAQGAVKTTASEGKSPVDASVIADEGATVTAPDDDEIAAEESGTKAAADGEIAASGTAEIGEIATSVSDNNAGVAAGGALAQELEPARFTEFTRKIIPFGGGE